MQKNKYILLSILLGIFFLAGLDLYGIITLRNNQLTERFIHTDTINAPDIGFQEPLGPSEEQAAFLNELKTAGLDKLHGREQVIAVMQWIMNSITKGPQGSIEPKGSPYNRLRQCREKDKGLMCGGMAEVCYEALTLLDVKARIIRLENGMVFSKNHHTTVEAFVDGKWAIFDPTFNVSYTVKSKPSVLLSAQEMKDIHLRGGIGDVEPVFYGEVAYPARLATYHTNYLALYNNVFVIHKRASLMEKIPPLNYFSGSAYYYQRVFDNEPGHSNIVEANRLIFLLLLPSALLVLAVLFLTVFLRSIIGRKGRA